MTTRKSPAESATLFKVGTKKKGLDEEMWEIVKTSNGIQRWRKITSSTSSSSSLSSASLKSKGKSYFTHDNGGNPFLVYVDKNVVQIFKQPPQSLETEDRSKTSYTKLIKRYDNVEKTFIGNSPLNIATSISGGHGPKFKGNSILLKLSQPKNRYVFIGERIYEFTSPEEITKYYSSVGNSDVPYPVALSDNFAYFMIGPSLNYKERKTNGGEYVPKTSFPKGIDWSDAYTQYYDLFPEKWYKDRKGKTFPFTNVKLIHKQIW